MELRPDAPADHSTEGLASIDLSLELSEHSPCLFGRTITLDDTSCSAKVDIHSGGSVLAPFGSVAVFFTGSPQTFSQRDVWIACSRLMRHLSRASRNPLIILGGALANRPLGKV